MEIRPIRRATVCEAIVAQLREFIVASARVPGGALRALREHRRILQAIKRGDSAGAERVMRTHLLTIERLTLGSDAATAPTRGDGRGLP